MERPTSDQVADEAGAWDARLRAPDCTDDDRARFAAWRDADREHRLAFEKIQAIVTTFRNNIGRADIRALRDAALRAEKRRRTRKRILSVAAAVATLAAGAVIWATLPDHTRRAPFQQLAALTDALLQWGRAGIYETGTGQRSTITLEDGSSVELNSRTRIKVAFSDTTRNVELLHGQALFHVAKNPQRPFIVRAADRDITAVGTAFDVRLDAASVRVTLLEGKVRVSKDSYLEPTRGRGETSLPGTNEIYLTPGQQFAARLSRARGQQSTDETPLAWETAAGTSVSIPAQDAVVRSIDVSKVIGWRDGRVFLEDLTLAEAVAEMNKYSELQIRVTDPQLAGLRVNGMFRAGEQNGFVAALEQYFPITAQRERETEITLITRR